MKDLITVSGVRGYTDETGTTYLHIEDVAKGLGFTSLAASGNEVVRWNTVHKYLFDLSVTTSCNGSDYRSLCPDFIPENIFYRLAMKAKNETAERFQALVADDILPSIRKHGMYAKDELLGNPDLLISVAIRLKQEKEKIKSLEEEKAMFAQRIAEYEPKVQYVDAILSSTGTLTVAQIAADYGLSPNKLNKILHEEKVQHLVNGQWLLYTKYLGLGYTKSEDIPITRSDGRCDTKRFTKWTQKGRLFIHNIIEKRGIQANMDQDNDNSIIKY